MDVKSTNQAVSYAWRVPRLAQNGATTECLDYQDTIFSKAKAIHTFRASLGSLPDLDLALTRSMRALHGVYSGIHVLVDQVEVSSYDDGSPEGLFR